MHATKDTKEIILKETFRLLLQKGYDAVSISDIQQATGMARGLLYHYFGNKEQLFFDVAERFLLQSFSIPVQELSSFGIDECIEYMVTKYDDICRSVSQEVDQEQSITIANYDFLIYRIIQENKQFATQYNTIRKNEIKVWETILRREKSENKLSDKVDIAVSAQHFVLLFDGIWLSTVSYGDANRLRDLLHRTLTQYYRLLQR